MTHRQPSPNSNSKITRANKRSRLRRRRLENRKTLLQSLESRQLLAGPDLIGIQPNEGALIREDNTTVLTTSPRELVFQFDDATQIDPDTLSAIRITRAGEDQVFESASALTDLQSGGTVLFEFRAIETGVVGNGIQVNLTSESRATRTPAISVTGRTIDIVMSNRTGLVTRGQDLASAVAADAAASGLIEVLQVSGSSFAAVGSNLRGADAVNLTLQGANAAQAVTDFGTNLGVQVRFVSQLPGADGRGTSLEFQNRNFGGQAAPVVVVNGQTVLVQLNSAPGFETTASDLIQAINSNTEASRILRASLEQGGGNTRIGGLAAGPSTLALGGVSDVVVEPGFVGLGDSPREVIFRFNEPLPDDTYQIDILGTGDAALTNVLAEAFNDGSDLSRRFAIDLGPKVAAVVPEPVRRQADGTLSPETGKIEVHFGEDRLESSLASNPAFYQLVFTRDTVDNTDDVTRTPTSVRYDNLTNIAELDFGGPLARLRDPAFDPANPDPNNPGGFLLGAARLRVGTIEGTPAAPTEFNLLQSGGLVDAADTFDGAIDLQNSTTGDSWVVSPDRTSSVTLSSEIFNVDEAGLNSPGPDVPGVRQIRPDDPTRLTRSIPLDHLRGGADIVNGISQIQYNFRDTWLGDDPTRPGVVNDTTYFNVISEQQRQRVREVLQLYSEYLGVSFVEVEGQPTSQAFISIVVGDLYGGDPRATSESGGIAVVTADTNGDRINDLGVMDFRDFEQSDDDQFGGEFFRGAMFAVGQLLGFGYADDLPQPVSQSTDFIFAPGTETEAVFPSVADIVHGQYLFRPDSTDIDMYKFTLATAGTLSVETIAERLASASLLDTQLRLYKQDANGAFVEVAQNDDYASKDSLIELEVDAGTYFIGVSAAGNDSYNPAIGQTGAGGLTEGEYELRLDFRPDAANSIRDLTGQRLDGDSDGTPGGVFDFWFVPSDPNNTLYVDKASSGVSNGLLGTIGNPYREIDQAIAAAAPGDTVRVVGNGGLDGRLETAEDNFSYQIGFDNNSFPLSDGTSIDLPQGVRMMIDSGAILKLSRARIGVGSSSPSVDRSDSALQIFGTPTIIGAGGTIARDATGAAIPGSVILTSLNDPTVGLGNQLRPTGAAQGGDWGGIDFRGDLDSADESRRFREDEGVFLNHIQYADLRFGGGAVSSGGVQEVISPIEMSVSRPTIMNSRISGSSDAAIAAAPSSFTETRFTEPFFQDAGRFTPDFTRVGPNIFGNTIVDNSINGLFIRVTTRSGDTAETITSTARFDDTDITHVLTENLVVAGTPGGPILVSSAPSSLLVRSFPTTVGSVPAGTYTYRITNVNAEGLESAPSQQTLPITLTGSGGVQLSGLPAAQASEGFTSRRLYRATVGADGLPGEFRLVARLNASSTSHVDRAAAGTQPLTGDGPTRQSRLDGSLTIDAGTILKIDGARIEARFGANLIAEGNPSQPIVFTSLDDQRYGTGGTFDTNDRGNSGEINPGDWGGIYIGHGSEASFDNVVVAGAGGTTRIEGGFASFNALEVHQADLRLVNSRFELNADGRGATNGTRVGRSDNAEGSVFVLASMPVVVNNEFVDNAGPALSFDVNSLAHTEVNDGGRGRGGIEKFDVVGNSGPLLEQNSLTGNSINGVEVRGGTLTTAGVWDDVDVVHVVRETIEIPNQHIFGGLRLQSDARGSLVVKFENGANAVAGIVAGGSLESASDQFVGIADRIGGALQLIGHADFPVVLTALSDDSVGAGFDLSGLPQVDTNNSGNSTGSAGLPTGPEVNSGTLIDNDVPQNIAGAFSFQPAAGGGSAAAFTTVQGRSQLFEDQSSLFAYGNFIDVGADGGAIDLGTTNITLEPTLIANDRVASEGNFQGENGVVNWRIEQFFENGSPTLTSEITLSSAGGIGDLRFINYYDPVIGSDMGDALFTEGAPGTDDFRLTILDAPEEIGFRQYGAFEPGEGLSGATYEGWIADAFPDLINPDAPFDLPFAIQGTVDPNSIPTQNLPQYPIPNYGPGILTSALAWQVDAEATTATITTNLEVIADVFLGGNNDVQAGQWNGVTIREGASDRNVAAVTETEPVRQSVFDTNAIPSQSQFLGELAPNEASGDENRRLGFVIDGAISTTDDLDVYSFVAESGTEVWLDIDRTSNSLDTVVELIDVNGRILASSNDSLAAETNGAALFTAANLDSGSARPLSVVTETVSSQTIRVSDSVVDATGGSFELNVEGFIPVLISTSDFLADPAGTIRAIFTDQFIDLGQVDVALQRRVERVTDPQNPAVVIREGGDFVIDLKFNQVLFAGQDSPTVEFDAGGVLGAAVTTSVTRQVDDTVRQDAYSTNPKDAGMRISLPGESGTRNLYHVRVRSSNTTDPLDFSGDIRDGLTTGSYQLQVRLGEVDEVPGTQIRLTDIRYAQTGLQIIGQPLHSPLLGEDYETGGPNDTLADAQRLGFFGPNEDAAQTGASGPLQSDQLAKSFAGEISTPTDVDWFRFDVNYDNLTRDEAGQYLSTVFDLDYADNFARGDMALYVFDEAGQLILVGGDSNIADDLVVNPDGESSNDFGDLSAGSAGTLDPFIGAAELREGSYYVAVSNQQRVPLPLDQFFNAGSSNPLLRLEPIDSVRRIAEDGFDRLRFGFSPFGRTASPPETEVLFDTDAVVPYTLDDMIMYVNTVNGISLVNPNTGVVYGTLNNFGAEDIYDVAFRGNGELFGYTGFGPRPDGDENWSYRLINTANGTIGAPISVGGGLETFHDLDPLIDDDPDVEEDSDVGFEVRAISIREFQGSESGFLVGNRQFIPGIDYSENVLFAFNQVTGEVTGPPNPLFEGQAGAAANIQEIGRINTAAPAVAINRQLGISAASVINANGVLAPAFRDGDQFTLSNGSQQVSFEVDTGPSITAVSEAVGDGDRIVVGDTIFEFDTGTRVQIAAQSPDGPLAVGSTVTVTGDSGQTATFEFVQNLAARPGNIAVPLTNVRNEALLPGQLSQVLARLISENFDGIEATSGGGTVSFGGSDRATITTAGEGLTVFGTAGLDTANVPPGSQLVGLNVASGTTPRGLISELASAMRGVGLPVSVAGSRLTLPGTGGVSIESGTAFALSGADGVAPGNIPITIAPTDSVDLIREQIVQAIENQVDLGNLDNVAASGQGQSIAILNSGFISSASGGFSAGGAPQGGSVQGVEVLGNRLFAVTNRGELYVVSQGELNTNGSRDVGTLVARATDLVGLNFTGLRAGPPSVEGGRFADTLFGITANGDIHAFNEFGELQPVFAGGRSSISTGIAGAQGFDFSTLDFNLWHATGIRGSDQGHGIESLGNGARGGAAGGSSLAFTYEASAFNGNFASVAERPVIGNNQNPRLDGADVERTYNFPGGARGAVESDPFSLESYAAADEPVLYFTYYSNTNGVDDSTPQTGLFRENEDNLRVYITTPDGTSHLVASNNALRGGGLSDDEFDDPLFGDGIDIDVQQLFDNTGSWRQARVELGDFAGMKDLSIRVEFSTGGTFATGSDELRTVAADQLREGQQFVINGEAFRIDFAPAISTPSGLELSELYRDPVAAAVITIDGQDYVLDDGTRVIAADQVAVDLLAGLPAGTALADATSVDVGNALAAAIRANPPTLPTTANLNFSDPIDAPGVNSGRNDLLFEATDLPYTGGSTRLEGTGRIGTFDASGALIDADDVDLTRLEVDPGTTISVDAEFFSVGGQVLPSGPPQVRFFDAEGQELTAGFDADGNISILADGGIVYIGFSGVGNTQYDPRVADSGRPGQGINYRAAIELTVPIAVTAVGNQVEIQGAQSVTSSPAERFIIDGLSNTAGVPVQIRRGMSAVEVARVVQQAIADEFFAGDTAPVPLLRDVIQLASLSLGATGPFSAAAVRSGDAFGAGQVAGAGLNDSEGVYLDDFVIGLAERGEIASNSAPVTGPFIASGLPSISSPPVSVSALQTGAYQVEIRDASEYVASGATVLGRPTFNGLADVNGETFGVQSSDAGRLIPLDRDLPLAGEARFRTFNSNDRLTDTRSLTARSGDQIRDGQTFSIDDGSSVVTFEFNLTESGTGVTPGNVAIDFTLRQEVPATQQIDPITLQRIPGTGVIRPNTASEVAASIIAAINRSDVQSVIDVPALPANGVDGPPSPVVNLFSDVVVRNVDGALESVDRSSGRGDLNRSRDAQGVILVENSRFLFNTQFGIDISHDSTVTVAGQETSSVVRYPRNLVELNSEGFIPGVVIQSNVIAHNEVGGLQIAGLDADGQGTGLDPVPFERIINNTIIGGSVVDAVQTPGAVFQGVAFAGGVSSFADRVAEYIPSAGGNPPAVEHRDADTALGEPDCNGRGPEPTNGDNTVSLGRGGSLTVEFVNNRLTASGDSNPDLVIFETGAIESVRVEISRDGTSFIDVGIVGGLTDRVDLDAFGFGAQDQFAFVRLTDLQQGSATGDTLGADIDAVGALSSVSPEVFTAGGQGVVITGNAAPTLLNNIVSNSTTGVVIDVANTQTVFGGNTFYRNETDASQDAAFGQFGQVIPDAETLFIDATNLVFGPAAGSSVIDSSIDSLADRASLTSVRNPLGLPPSPIVAPRLDVNGQLRVDDPSVETPSGLGERVFKDRGAFDRGDQVGPRVVLLSPQAPNLGTGAGSVNVFGNPPTSFELQILDGLAPADVVPGTGVNDASVSSSSILLFRDNVPLVEGVDYRFGYNPSTNVVRLTPIAGVWEENSTYVIRMVDGSDAIIAATDGAAYEDAQTLTLVDAQSNAVTFEYETGIVVTLNNGIDQIDSVDGAQFTVFDGVRSRTFELDSDNSLAGSTAQVAIAPNSSVAEITAAIAAAVNRDAGFGLAAVAGDRSVQFVGTNPLSSVEFTPGIATVNGQVGTSPGFGLQLPASEGRLDEELGDGDSFTIFRGAEQSVTFEFDSDGTLVNEGATAVPINAASTLDSLADALVRAIGGAGLGLAPANVGFGRVVLGGNANYSLVLGESAVTQIALPGLGATTPIGVRIDQTQEEVAAGIADVIGSSGLQGLEINVIDRRIFVEGLQQAVGVGASDVSVITDEVGNALQSNQANGSTTLTVFIGNGFDYGDAPAPYTSRAADGGPRHSVNPDFALSLGSSPNSLSAPVTADSDAALNNADIDDGIQLPTAIRPGFGINIDVGIINVSGQSHFLDAWFDWNGNGQFESDEVSRFSSAVVQAGRTTLPIRVPADAALGQTYARFRLSDEANLGANGVGADGQAPAGEVEDYLIDVTRNPFQNGGGGGFADVNASGLVTPLDALHVINFLSRAGNAGLSTGAVDLSVPQDDSLFTFAKFPDVDSNGVVTPSDALSVINYLAQQNPILSGEAVSVAGDGSALGEQTSLLSGSYQPVAAGVMASQATVIGDALAVRTDDESLVDPQHSAAALPSKLAAADSSQSVFDSPAVMNLDSIVDTLAEDRESVEAEESPNEKTNLDSLDQWFAEI